MPWWVVAAAVASDCDGDLVVAAETAGEPPEL